MTTISDDAANSRSDGASDIASDSPSGGSKLPNATEPLLTKPIELAPSYAIPLVLLALALALLFWQPWVGGIVALLGLFLGVQAATLRLRFSSSALDIYRGERCIRQFPYQDWQSWQIFWPNFPVLLYFREVNSIHFLPVLFDAKMLHTCLERYCSTQV